jgi:hypothetical protein
MKNSKIMRKRKFRNRLKLGILLFSISLLLWNCNKDESLELITETTSIENVQTVSFEDAIHYFNNNESKNVSAKETNSLILNPDWNTLNQQSLFNTSALLTNAETSVNREGDFSSELFFIKIDGEIKNVIYTIYKDSIDNNGNIINARFFLNHTNGDFIDGYQIVNANTLKRLTIKYNSSISKNSLLAKSDTKDEDCWNTDNLPADFTFDTVWIEGSSGGGGSLGGWSGFTGSTRGSISTTGGNSGGEGTSSGGYGTGSGTSGTGGSTPNDSTTLTAREIKELAGAIVVNPPITPEDTESCGEGYYMDLNGYCVEEKLDQIILDSTFLNNPRLKCVYTKFEAGTNTISDYLENFLGEKPVAHLNFIADDNFKANNTSDLWGAGAITSPPVDGYNNSSTLDYNIDIIFNTDIRLPSSEHNMPTIILATELIHEMVHAEMYRKLLASAHLPNVNWNNYSDAEWRNFVASLANNYEGLFTYYNRYYWNNPNPTSPQHNMMASHYREMIVSALKDFDNNQHTDAFYNALAWIGLKNTVAWNASSTDRASINAIISNAIKNETHDCTN